MESEKNIYPIGRYAAPEQVTHEMRSDFIARIDTLPMRLREVVNKLTPKQLTESYREGGWNARQIIHHIADSHVNGYVRFKLALTEDTPIVKPYNENEWAALDEIKMTEVLTSVALLEQLHLRWVNTLRSMKPEDFERCYTNPQYQRTSPLNQILALYAWHGDHHLGQIEYILLNKSTI